MLLGFRALQGLSAGVGLIVGRAVVRDVLHGHDAQRLMSQVSMIFGIAPAIAPVIGGWMLGWRAGQAIFWFLVAFAVGCWRVIWCRPAGDAIRRPQRTAAGGRGRWCAATRTILRNGHASCG